MTNTSGPLVLSDDLKKCCSDILEWKNKYSNIYYQKIEDREYIFRLLTKSEYLALYFIQFHVSNEAEDILLDKCVLYPQFSEGYFNDLKAGEVAVLVERILSLSGFSSMDNVKEDLDREREKIGLLDNQIVLIICKAFPYIKPSDVDKFDYPTILHYVSLAEELLGTKLEIKKPEQANKIDFDKENREQGFPREFKPGGPDVKQQRR